jgi:hypothetical protein
MKILQKCGIICELAHSNDEQLVQSIDRKEEKTKNEENFWSVFKK